MKQQDEDLAQSCTGAHESPNLACHEDDSELEELETRLRATAPQDYISLEARNAIWSDLLKTFAEHTRGNA